MCPVYINRIASIHAESRNEKPYFSAQEPDYKEMITNANLRRRMSMKKAVSFLKRFSGQDFPYGMYYPTPSDSAATTHLSYFPP